MDVCGFVLMRMCQRVGILMDVCECVWIHVGCQRMYVCMFVCLYLSPSSMHTHTYRHTSTPGVVTVCLVLLTFEDTCSYVWIHVHPHMAAPLRRFAKIC